MDSWEKANRIRKYLAVLKGLEGQIDGIQEWTQWISSQADLIDPLKNLETLVFRYEEKAEEPGWWW